MKNKNLILKLQNRTNTKKNKIILYLFVLSISSLNAQWYHPENVNKKLVDKYNIAYHEFDAGKFENALLLINQCLLVDTKFVDGLLAKADIYANLKKYDSAQNIFENAINLDSIYTLQFLNTYSNYLANLGKFNLALSSINKYISSNTLNKQNELTILNKKNSYQFAVDYEKKHSIKNYSFTPLNLGDSINTKLSEYYPSITIDNNKIIFTRRVSNNDEDFFESNFINGAWSKATPLKGNINTNFKEGALSISEDGQCIVFAASDYPEGYGNFDLYLSYKNATGWSIPENLGGLINTDFWESSPSLSPDKKDLYFSSSVAGGYGGKDIWVSHKSTSGKWGKPQNLGAAINTAGDESCPFIHADNETLYFSSNGKQGYGNADLFFSKKINDSSWLEAENLGYPINTVNDEGSLIVAADAKTAYFASDRFDSKGGLDLYTFQLREDIRPKPSIWVKGKVYDKNSLNGLQTIIELTDIKTQKIISKLQTEVSGNYLITLPIGSQYAFNVNKKGYLFYSNNFIVNPLDSSINNDIALQPLLSGASIILNNIFFENKQYNLNPTSIFELNKIVALLNDNLNLKIEIDGHTDNIGNVKANNLLSINRAKAVVNYLISKNINLKRLTYKGFGDSKPIANNNLEIGRAANRRTELIILSN